VIETWKERTVTMGRPEEKDGTVITILLQQVGEEEERETQN